MNVTARILPSRRTPSPTKLMGGIIWCLILALQISGCSKKREAELSEEQQESLYLKSDFDNKVFSVKLDSKEQTLEENGESITKYEIAEAKADHKLAKLFERFLVEGRPSQIMQVNTVLRSDNKLIAYKKVTQEEIGQLSKFEQSLARKTSGSDFQVELFSYNIDKYGVMEKVKNDLNETTNKLRLKETTFQSATHFMANFDGAKVLPVAKKIDDLKKYDPSKIVNVDDFRGKEFLFRRTLIDSPNLFGETFAGTSGRLEIVKFIFKDGLLEVRRSGPLLAKEGVTSVDEETLMAFPASYYKVKNVDGQGNSLSSAEYIEANPEEKNIIAIVDWDKNSIPNDVTSPLSFFGLEQCFSGARAKEVQDLENTANKGSLNFTLLTTYASSNGLDCVKQIGYFDSTQTTFSFKERFSFRKYDSRKEGETPLLNIPFDVQKKLGFGLFTYEKINPTELGATDTKNTRIPLPAIFDIRKDGASGNFKNIVYVLAGIPSAQEDAKLRKRVIVATREVIDDLNEAFKKALKSTPMEREEAVVQLQVEGLSADEEATYQLKNAAKKTMGDLDRNYIYFIRKGTDSSIIGLGGAHSNPRSGKVEAASVFIYGGNIKTYVGSLKTLRSSQSEYLKNLKLPEGVPYVIPDETEPTAPAGPQDPTAPTTPTTPPVQPSARTALAGISSKSFMKLAELARNAQGKTPDSEALVGRLMERAEKEDLQALLDPFEMASKTASGLNNAGPSYVLANVRALESVPAAKAFYLKFQKAIQENALLDPTRMEAIFGGKIEDGKVVENLSKRELSKVLGSIQNSGICLFHGPSLENMAAAVGAGTAPAMSDEDIIISIYKPTLAHELGHNFGLRHNFMGSYDKMNHFFSPEDQLKNLRKRNPRDYSSIMDYLSNDFETYDGYGPQDVHSLRAAYGGMVLKDGDPFAPLSSKLISLDKVLQESGLTSWYDIKKEHLKNLNIKDYKFCSDEDVYVLPTCDRFDRGTTPDAIVEDMIANYKMNYSLRNFARDRISFPNYSGSYIGSLATTFGKLRLFLTRINNLFDTDGMEPTRETLNEYFHYIQAAFTGYEFLKEVVRTPDAAEYLPHNDNSRFEIIESSNAIGQRVHRVIERKWLTDKNMDGNDNRELAVRGVEIDKILAILTLTTSTTDLDDNKKGQTFPSYYFLEKFLLPIMRPDIYSAGVTRENSPFLLFIKEVMLDRISPMATFTDVVKDADGKLSAVRIDEDLSNSYKSTSSLIMQSLAYRGAVMGLQSPYSQTIEQDPSTAFSVLSKSTPPENTDFITMPKAVQGDKLWADDDAVIAKSMIAEGAALAKLEKMSPLLMSKFGPYITLALEEVPEDKKEEQKTKLKAAEEEINTMLTQLPAGTFGPAGSKPLTAGKMLGLAAEMIELGNELAVVNTQLAKSGDGGKPSKGAQIKFKNLLEKNTINLELLSRTYPVLTVFLASVDEKFLNKYSQAIQPDLGNLTAMRGSIFQAAKELSSIFYILNDYTGR